jgi:8-oxo-dGTP pyrophosphatase MutT (NUDIX family)
MDLIEVAVTIIAAGEKILIVRNEKWGTLTLPMTKIQRKPLGLAGNLTKIERWSDAAMRNIGECLGRTLDHEPKLLLDVGEMLQSDRTGQVNHYHFQVYLVEVDSEQAAPGLVAEWRTTSQIRDESRRPISPTARELAKRLDAEAAGRGLSFPPNGPPRTSQAAVAIIARQDKGKKRWLVQWNKDWGRYYLVGGHREEKESGTECLARELREELKIGPREYEAVPMRAEPLKYVDWSVRFWRDTDYTVWPFRVTLSEAAVKKVSGDAANRWITKQEILDERCEDDRPVSPTTKKTLKTLGEI